jgi:hypothetical protein
MLRPEGPASGFEKSAESGMLANSSTPCARRKTALARCGSACPPLHTACISGIARPGAVHEPPPESLCCENLEDRGSLAVSPFCRSSRLGVASSRCGLAIHRQDDFDILHESTPKLRSRSILKLGRLSSVRFDDEAPTNAAVLPLQFGALSSLAESVPGENSKGDGRWLLAQRTDDSSRSSCCSITDNPPPIERLTGLTSRLWHIARP